MYAGLSERILKISKYTNQSLRRFSLRGNLLRMTGLRMQLQAECTHNFQNGIEADRLAASLAE